MKLIIKGVTIEDVSIEDAAKLINLIGVEVTSTNVAYRAENLKKAREAKKLRRIKRQEAKKEYLTSTPSKRPRWTEEENSFLTAQVIKGEKLNQNWIRRELPRHNRRGIVAQGYRIKQALKKENKTSK